MLLELDLRDFVLIKQASFSFPQGLTVLTGETGAGKSLLVQAMKLLLGAKAGPGHVRPGADQAVVQGVFDPVPETLRLMEELGIPEDEGLIVRRILPVSGRGRIYVNGALVTLQDLKRLTGELASIASQHDFQALLRKSSHRTWLDRFCGIESVVEQVHALHDQLKRLKGRIEDLKARRNLAEEETQELKQQAKKIDQLAPKPGEDETLEQEITVLKSAQTLRDLGSSCYQALYAGKGSVDEVLHQCRQDLERMAQLDPTLSPTLEELQSAIYQAQEVSFALRDYLNDITSDPARLRDMEQRLYELRELMRIFGPTIEDVLSYRKEIDQRLSRLEAVDEDLSVLEREAKERKTALLELVCDLSEHRSKGAEALSEAVKRELKDLGLEKTRFLVSVSRPSEPCPEDVGPWGMDQVEFLFSPNPGQPLRPLSAIASGGELSRVMLALKAALAGKMPVETMVFDEIDAGIGGEVANQVAERLRRLSRSGQVIAITHFPQIASRADFHLHVDKRVSAGQTITEVRPLQGEERLRELMRMLGGDSEAAKLYAMKLLGVEGENGGGA